MVKILSKWFRKIHRWIAVPTAILIPIAFILKFTSGPGKHFPPQFEQFQSILMLSLAVTGSYLFLLPYLMKWIRKRRPARRAHKQPAPPSRRKM